MQYHPEVLHSPHGQQVLSRFLHDFARRGGSVILISSEMPEIIGLSHRVAVMRSGVLTGILEGDAVEEGEIVRYATGLKGRATRGEQHVAVSHA